MSDTVRVGSRLITDVEIVLDGATHVIVGVSHPISDGMAVTEGVPADAFHRWMAEHGDTPMVANQMVFPIPDGHDVTPRQREFGYQPMLDRVAGDADQQRLAEQGVPEAEDPPAAGAAVPLPDPIPAPPAFQPAYPPQPPAPPAADPAPAVVPPDPPAPVAPAPASDDPTQDSGAETRTGIALDAAHVGPVVAPDAPDAPAVVPADQAKA